MTDYIKAAEGNITAAATSGDERLLVAAQTYATLALAYEQRTANLIAFFASEDITDTSTHCIDYRALADQIEERLGLA